MQQMQIRSTYVLCSPHHQIHVNHGIVIPIEKNVLGSMLKTMCSVARIEGTKTNHSLQATGATDMFKAGVPEKSYNKELAIFHSKH